MTTITALPTAPSRADTANFATRADAWITQFTNTTTGEINTVAGEVNANATSAASQVTLATAQATAAANAATEANSAAAAAGAIAWVSGTTYAIGNARFSLINFQTYRRTTVGAGTTDPSLDSANWTLALKSAGSGGTTGTGNITLTASSPAAMTITPATPGLYVTLPDATTCTKADNLFAVYNAGDYDYGVKDSAGTQLGWIRARTGAMIGLADNATAAGTWAYYGLEKVGVTSQFTGVSPSALTLSVAIDSTRTLFYSSTGNCYAVVFDSSTATWGAIALVRATILGSVAVKSSTNQVLFASSDSTTAFQAVTLTITGTSITVNTPVNLTLGAAFGGYLNLIAVGAAFGAAYLCAGNLYRAIAISVTGTVPTISAENTAMSSAYAGGIFVVVASGSVMRVVYTTSTTNYNAQPFTISGATITAGSAAAIPYSGSLAFKWYIDGSGNILMSYINGNHYLSIIKLTGTVEAVTSASYDAYLVALADAAVISSTKTLTVSSPANNIYINIVTDTAGAISLGTQISIAGSGVSAYILYCDTSIARIIVLSTGVATIYVLDVSGTSPTITTTTRLGYISSPYDSMPVGTSNNFVRAAASLKIGTSVISIASSGSNGSATIYTYNTAIRKIPMLFYGTPTIVGQALNESFSSSSDGTRASLQRIEAAA